MKKIVFTFITCLACIPSVHAAVSNLGQSVRENQAILESPLLFTTLPEQLSITNIQRTTAQNNVTGTVFYRVSADPQPPQRNALGDNNLDVNAVEGTLDINTEEMHCGHKRRRNRNKNPRTINYTVTLDITPNPGIGPNIITVTDIQKTRR